MDHWVPDRRGADQRTEADVNLLDKDVSQLIEGINELAWFDRKRRIREYYAAAEYQGRMSDFCAKICQFSEAAYQSIGKRKVTIPYPGKLKMLPAPALVDTVEVVLQVRESGLINPHVMYLRIRWCNSTETIYTISTGSFYEVEIFQGAMVEPIPTYIYDQVMECETDIFRRFIQRIRRMANNPFWLPDCTDITEQTQFEQYLNERMEERLNPELYS